MRIGALSKYVSHANEEGRCFKIAGLLSPRPTGALGT